MGCSCYSNASNESDILRVAVFGLENSGKTSLIQCLKNPKQSSHTLKSVSTHGTVGIHVHLNVKMNINLIIFDCGGCKHQRHIWPHLVNNSDLVVFTIDVNDLSSLDSAKQALFDLLADDSLINKPLLIIFTKLDERNSRDIQQLDQYFDLSTIQDRSIRKLFFSSKTLDGVAELSKWFTYFSYCKRHEEHMKLSVHEHLS